MKTCADLQIKLSRNLPFIQADMRMNINDRGENTEEIDVANMKRLEYNEKEESGHGSVKLGNIVI